MRLKRRNERESHIDFMGCLTTSNPAMAVAVFKKLDKEGWALPLFEVDYDRIHGTITYRVCSGDRFGFHGWEFEKK